MLTTETILTFAWLTNTSLMLVLIAMLVSRRLHRQFPWFLRYALLVVGRVPVLYFLRQATATGYFYGYWIAEALTVAFSFPVLFEVYRYVAGSSRLRISHSAFFSLCVAFFALAAIVSQLVEHAPSPLLIKLIFVLSYAVRTMQIGLLAVLLIGSVFYNFYWQSFPFGVALGYGIYALIELAAAQLRNVLGAATGGEIFRLAKVLGYEFAVILWIGFLWRHRAEHALKELPSQSVLDWTPLTGRSQ